MFRNTPEQMNGLLPLNSNLIKPQKQKKAGCYLGMIYNPVTKVSLRFDLTLMRKISQANCLRMIF